MQNLIDASQVFSFDIPDWLEDGQRVGQIAGNPIYAGEVRRLQKALDEAKTPTHSLDDEYILSLMRKGERIQAIKHRRITTSEELREAKDYCDALGLRDGCLYRGTDGLVRWNEQKRIESFDASR
jgi:hypothetical protein